MEYIWNFVLALCLMSQQAHSHTSDDQGTPCSNPQGENLEGCLEAIRKIAQDNERFFFGTSYQECPPERSEDIECSNRFPFRNNSIVSALFRPGTFDPDVIDRFLEVQYTSEPGEYTGCDYHYKQEEPFHFHLDPSSDESHKPWDTRGTPLLSWEADPDKQYTLIAQDVAYGFMHGVYINIPGNDMEKAVTIMEYSGPKSFKKDINPYAMMLFEQTQNDMEVPAEWLAIIYNPYVTFNISDFQDQTALKGPIAMNWILSSFDAYSVVYIKEWAGDNCAGLVEQEIMLTHGERPFFSDETSLSVNTRVEIHSEAFSFTYCCLHVYREQTVFANPIGNGLVDPVLTREGSILTVHVTPRYNRFDGGHYTMLVVDPDVPFPDKGTEERPLVHWMIVNAEVTDGQLTYTSDDELLSYLRPAPPDDKPHTYYFLLFHQATEYTADLTEYSAEECFAAGRCLFDVNAYVKDYGLTLAGATWFRAENNDYIQMLYDVPEEEACADRACTPVVGGASVVMPTLTAVNQIISMLLVVFLSF